MTDNLNKIIAGCISDDRQSQEELYKLLSPKMYSICCQYASDSEEARDFLQEGFIKVFEKIKSYRSEGSFEGWVRKIMINTALQLLRKKKMTFKASETITEDVSIEIPDIQLDFEQEDLLKMVHNLPVNQRVIFNLYAIEGYNHTDIAKMTGIPENTSKSHLHRARVALKEMIKAKLSASGDK